MIGQAPHAGLPCNKALCPSHWCCMQILFRCALLCKAALEAPWHVPCGGVPYGDSNLAFIANDWHTALLPLYLQARLCPTLPC